MSDIGIQFHKYNRLLLNPLKQDSMQPEVQQENMRRLAQHLGDRTRQGTMEPIAIMLGGIYYHEVVVPGDATEERELRHNLGYIPSGIVMAFSVVGQTSIGSLVGKPGGGGGAGNTSPWTTDRIYIAHRSTIDDTVWNLVVV